MESIEITRPVWDEIINYKPTLWDRLCRIPSSLGWHWYRFRRGLKNVIRYTPIVWSDEDFDWSGLATILAYKFEKMAEVHKNGHLVKAPKSERQLRIAAHCVKRLRADNYLKAAGWSYPEKITNYQMKRAGWARCNDQTLLGKMIGKYLITWWD